MYIAIEGLDGSGKSTACKKISEMLRAAGLEVLEVAEPGTTQAAQKIRTIHKEYKVSDEVRTLLMNAARIDLLQQLVVPALKAGSVVISDRCYLSTDCYQSGFFAKQVDELVFESPRCGCVRPDIIFFINASPEVCKARMIERGEPTDAMESKGDAFFEAAYQRYLDAGTALEEAGVKYCVVTSDTREGTVGEIWAVLQDFIQK